MIWLAVILLIFILISAVATIFVENIKTVVLVYMIGSLLGSLVFMLFKAPDVAIAEAAIGAALTGAVFFFVLNIKEKGEEKGHPDA